MLRLVQVGLGPVGIRLAKVVLDRMDRGGKSVNIVGAVDPAPEKVGKDLGELCGVKPLGVKVARDVKAALGRNKADVALVATVSKLKAIEPQIAEFARAGLNVVSTCEELVFPWHRDPAAAARIDKTCKKHGVTCLSTGVNPGFLMDLLPCVLTGVSQRVDSIVVKRIQDATFRRIPFQQKIGAGLTRAEFAAKLKTGAFGHVGLPESMYMISRRMGWKIDKMTERIRPVIAKEKITSGYTPIAPGMCCGIEQIGKAYAGKKAVITLEFRAAVGEKTPADTVEVHGVPDLTSVIPGGVNGDIATCAITFNAAQWVVAAEPGLKTMLDIPAISYFAV